MKEPQLTPPPSGLDEDDHDQFNLHQFDGVNLRVNAEDDDFEDTMESDDESDTMRLPKRTLPPSKEDPEEIPPEVIEQLKSNLALTKYLGDLIEARVDACFRERDSAEGTSNKKGKRMSKQMAPGNNLGKNNNNLNHQMVVAIKSPSDTTIYRPALAKGLNQTNDAINKISDFVENIKIGMSWQTTPANQPSERKHDESAS